jgi:hypothetical protein
MLTDFQAPRFRWNQIFTIFFLILLCVMYAQAMKWNFDAKIVPIIVGTLAIAAVALSLLNDMCRRPKAAHIGSAEEHAEHEGDDKMHMDLASDTAHLPVRTIATRGMIFFGYLLGFMCCMYLIGLIPTVGIFVVLFMRVEAKERWTLVIPYAVFMVLFIYIGFDQFMAIPWPQTLLGTLVPAMKFIPSV